MSLASWKPDPNLTREKHNWVFDRAYPQEWGCTIQIRCANSGCPTTLSYGVRKEEWADKGSGICFDQHRAVQITDRDGNSVRAKANAGGK